jgi:hypothetical protein
MVNHIRLRRPPIRAESSGGAFRSEHAKRAQDGGCEAYAQVLRVTGDWLQLYNMRMDTLNSKSFSFGAGSLKVIAIIAMTANHISATFEARLPFTWGCVLSTIGGITFPTLVFLLTEGYQHTRSFKRYSLRLLIFAIISIVPFMFIAGPKLNVLFTLLLGLLIIRLYDALGNKVVFFAILAGVTAFTYYCDWAIVGVPMIFVSYVCIGNRVKRVVFPVFTAYVFCAINLIIPSPQGESGEILSSALFFFVGCTLTIPLLLKYNGKRSRKLPKYLFYAYYPAHLTALFLIHFYLFGLTLGAEYLFAILKF